MRGLNNASVVISSERGLWFRTFGLGGATFTSALVKQFQVTNEQAEVLKRAPAKARRYHLYRAASLPLLQQLGDEIGRSLINHSRLHPGERISHLYCIGGGVRMHGLLRQLRLSK